MQLLEHKLSKDGVATIHVIGSGRLGGKSANLVHKAPMLEECGFLFPRRNLGISSDVLLEGMMKSGLKDGWNAQPQERAKQEFKQAFGIWAVQSVWPVAKAIFEGRSFYIRSDAPLDSLGRGVYDSEPFLNNSRSCPNENDRAEIFARGLYNVVMSYFGDAAAEFRKRSGALEEGMNVQLSQFIGRFGDLNFEGRVQPALAPFLSAVVKTSRFGGKGGGLVRFEYGMGSGALKGRSILLGQNGETSTIVGKNIVKGIDTCPWNSRSEIMLEDRNVVVELPGSNRAALSMFMKSAYPEIKQDIDKEAQRLLWWLAENNSKIEEKNGGIPLYLELVSSSYKKEGTIRWFVVQDADYTPMENMPALPERPTFVSGSDFSGHGQISGKRKLFVFGPDACGGEKWLLNLEEINSQNEGYAVAIPQSALSGFNLTALTNMSARYFSNAAAVLEYESLGHKDSPKIAHEIGRQSSEHFEQLALDFEILFIPVKHLFGEGESGMAPEKIGEYLCDATFVCDKERGIAWGKVDGIFPASNA